MAEPRPAHPGTIVFFDEDREIGREPVEAVPEEGRFARDREGRWVPIVKVVRRAAGPNERVVSELGPGDALLRRTVQRQISG
jgi:hypothetical protein